jgi:hypothetical protein
VEILPSIKRGDTFEFYADIAIPEASSGIVERSQVRDSVQTLYAELTIEPTSVINRFLLTAIDTEKWPIGELYMDIEYNINGKKKSSPTYIITVEEDITHD